MITKGKIVFVNQSVGYLTQDTVNAFVDKCEQLALIVGNKEDAGKGLHESVICSECIRYNKKSMLTRILTWLISTLQITFLLLTKYRGWHVVYFTNPPLSYWVSLLVSNSFSIVVYDIYPDALYNIVNKDNPICRLWAKVNRKIFAKAEHIYTLSEGMANLLSNYCNRRKIEVIPCWMNGGGLRPLAKAENPFVLEQGLQDKFVVMYSGNIGYTHNVETMIELATKLKDYEDICFYIVGEGLKKKMLIEKVKNEKLQNCYFLPYQPADKVRYSLASAGLSVITLTPETAFVSVPSKTYNLLAVGSPLLVIAPKQSEIDNLVTENNCGESFCADEVDAMVEYILELRNDAVKRNLYSENALRTSEKYTKENAKRYVEVELNTNNVNCSKKLCG